MEADSGVSSQNSSANEKAFATLLSAVPIATLIAEATTGTIVYANEEALRLFERKHDELVGVHYRALHPEMDAKQADATFRYRPCEGETPPTVVIDIVMREGARKTVEITGRVMNIDRREYVIGVFKDITQRMRAERALRENHERYQLLVKAMSDGVALFEGDRITYVSPSYVALFGYGIDEIESIGYETIAERIHPEDRVRIMNAIHSAHIHQMPLLTYRYRGKRKDGTYIQIEDKLRLFFNKDGSHNYTIINGRDVTESVEKERALLKSEEKFKSIFNAANDAIFIADAETGTLIDANHAAVLLTGRTHDDIVGSSFTTLHPPQQLESAKQGFFALSKEGRELQHFDEVDILHVDGHTTPIEINATVVGIDGRPCFYAIFRDISERKKAEKALDERMRELRLAQKIAHVGNWRYNPATNEMMWSDEIYRIHQLPLGTKVPTNNEYRTQFAYDRANGRRFVTSMRTAIREGTPFDIVLTFALPSGTTKWAHVICEPGEKTEKGYILHGTMQDITNKKETENALIATAEKLMEAQAIAKMGAWELNLTTDTLTWTDEVYHLFDVAPQSFPATYKAFLAHVHPDDRARVDEAYQTSLQTKRPYTITHRILSGTGSVKYVEERCRTEYAEDGRPLRSAGVVIDITEQRENERRLQVLFSTARGVLENYTFNTAMRHIFEACREVTSASAGYIALKNETSETMEVLFMEEGDLACTLNAVLPLPLHGYFTTGEAVCENNFMESTRWARMPKGHIPLQNILLVPLRTNEQSVGLIALANKPDDFTEKDIDIARIFADMAAIALTKTRAEEKLHAELMDKKQSIMRAQEVQQQLNTRALPVIDAAAFSALYMPSEELSGDFINIVETERHVSIILGDSTGHGIEASMDATLLQSICDRHIHALCDIASPDLFLSLVNHDIARYLTPGKYPTMIALVLEKETCTLSYANANAPLPYRFSRPCDESETSGTFFPKVKGFHLGFDTQTTYAVAQTTVGGKRVLVYSDSLYELHDREGQPLGLPGMQALLSSIEGAGDVFLRELVSRLKEITGVLPLHDDLTLLLIEAFPKQEKTVTLTSIEEIVQVKALMRKTLACFAFDTYFIETFLTATHELLKNAITHGNKCDPLKNVTVTFTGTHKRVTCDIKDEGAGAPISTHEQAIDSELLSAQLNDGSDAYMYGRGVWLARRYVDHLAYSERGTRVTIEKALVEKNANYTIVHHDRTPR